MDKYATNAGVISAAATGVAIRVMPADVGWIPAKTGCCVVGLTMEKEHDHEIGV
ncbi:MAG: hypothetical protein ABI604_02875 [Nitrospirota bacterium]